MSSNLIIQPFKDGGIKKDPSTFHDRKYMLNVVCEVAKIEKTGLVHRGCVFKVLRNATRSALVDTLEERGNNEWEVYREPELFMNGPFPQFENQIKQLYYVTLGGDATLELKYNENTDQVSWEYMNLHGFTAGNAPWSALARHYKEGKPVTRRMYKEKYGVDTKDGAKQGFEEHGFKEQANANLDARGAEFSPEDLKEAEIQAEIIDSSGMLGEKDSD